MIGQRILGKHRPGLENQNSRCRPSIKTIWTFYSTCLWAGCRLRAGSVPAYSKSSLCDPEHTVQCCFALHPLFPQRSLWEVNQKILSMAADAIFSALQSYLGQIIKPIPFAFMILEITLMPYSFHACQWEQEESWSLSRTRTCKHTDTCLNQKAAKETKPETFKMLGYKSYPERKKRAIKYYLNLRELDSKSVEQFGLTCLPPSLPLPSLLPESSPLLLMLTDRVFRNQFTTRKANTDPA